MSHTYAIGFRGWGKTGGGMSGVMSGGGSGNIHHVRSGSGGGGVGMMTIDEGEGEG
jgi:hypothetical protein